MHRETLISRLPRKRFGPPALRHASGTVLICMGAGLLSGCDPALGGDEGGSLVAELGAAQGARPFMPRASGATEYRPCSRRLPAGGTIPRATCRTAYEQPSNRELQIGMRASAAVRGALGPDALHAAALLDMFWADTAGTLLDRSISNLRATLALTDRRAPVLADLAAAHLVRAEQAQTSKDLLVALELAEAAVAQEPRNLAALFNRAAALDGLTADGQAEAAWGAYLAVDSTSGWAGEARARMAALQPRPSPTAPRPGDGIAVARAYAERTPQEAQLLGWDRLLPAWGAAVLRDDSAAAERSLRTAAALGHALERRGGDATLADGVRAIRARAVDRRAVRALAEAHTLYGAARAEYHRAHYARADTLLGRALAGRGATGPLDSWTRVFYGATRVYSGHASQGLRLLRQEVAKADTMRHPALAARARWNLASVLVRDTLPEQALRLYEQAAGLFARIGEQEHLGAVQYLSSEAQWALGNSAAAWTLLHRGLTTLRPYRGSPRLHNALLLLSHQAGEEGLAHAALRLQQEDVAVARRGGVPLFAVEAYLARARLRAAVGDARGALTDVSDGEPLLATLPPDARAYFAATLRLTRADASRGTDAAAAAAALDSAIGYFRSKGNAEWLFRALVSRAQARLLLGHTDAAEQDLDRVFALLNAQRAAAGGARIREVEQAAREAIDNVLVRRISEGQVRQALALTERARAVLSATGRGGKAGGPLPAPPAGQVAVSFALVGGELMAWTIAGSEVRLTRTQVPRERLGLSVERARAALELGADSAATRELTMLYEWVVRPVAEKLGAPGTPVTVLADPLLARIPFSALFDARRGRYWVQDHPLSLAGSLRDAAHPEPRGASTGRVVLVAPSSDSRTQPGLAPLPSTSLEVNELAELYSHTLRLHGEDADADAVARTLPQAAVFHFAGHAVSDDARPERSYLVLAPDRSAGGPGRLTAADLEQMDLRNVRLVVFSACETLRSPDGGSGGFAGLGGAVLGAGAHGVVGSLWPVDDALTRRLMTAFHRAYRQSGDAAAALRQAQLELLASPDPRLRSPAAWAGFQYAGR